MDNDISWPRTEPEKWRGVQLTRDLARKELLDAILEGAQGLEALSDAIDAAQGDAQRGESYVLIHIVDE